MSERYIKVYGAIMDWCWYHSVNEKVLFLHCLLKANWKDLKMGTETINRGSFVTTITRLSEETGLSVQQVRSALEHLESTGEIRKKTTNKYHIISVEKYEDFQADISKTQQASNKQITLCIEDIEREDIRNIDNIYISNNNTYRSDNSNELASKSVRSRSKEMEIPTLLEVEAHIEEKGYHISAEAFWNYYNSQGWKKSNGVALKDWKSACVTWEQRQRGNEGKVW